MSSKNRGASVLRVRYLSFLFFLFLLSFYNGCRQPTYTAKRGGKADGQCVTALKVAGVQHVNKKNEFTTQKLESAPNEVFHDHTYAKGIKRAAEEKLETSENASPPKRRSGRLKKSCWEPLKEEKELPSKRGRTEEKETSDETAAKPLYEGGENCKIFVYYCSNSATGDCLFATVSEWLDKASASIEDMPHYSAQKVRQLAALSWINVPLKNIMSMKNDPLKKNAVRTLIRETYNDQDNEQMQNDFYTKLGTYAALEERKDTWEPKSILKGKTSAASKAIQVYEKLSTSGNTHWGDATDVQNLEDILNTGIILIKNEKVYCYGRKDIPRKYYMLIHYEDQVHFQLAGVKCIGEGQKTNEGVQVIFKREDIPEFITNRYEYDCRSSLV